MRFIRHFSHVLILAAGLQTASAFSLLGPFAPWMTAQLAYQDGGFSIGGPMNIGEGYRWNVPVVTYGFDQSFVDYFGSNGVAAVESAIQILNDLPPSSAIDPNAYTLNSSRINHAAEGKNLLDLKSSALAALVEQMGLAQPTRFNFTLRDFTDLNNYTVIMRNFDPVSFAPSSYVNGTGYYDIVAYSSQDNVADAVEYPIDPTAPTYTAVADLYESQIVGEFYLGLTRDDVGGLRYLLSTNNVALENLLPGVTGAGTNAGNYVTTALRPGVDKITFQRLDYDNLAAHFVPVTNQYVDSYVSNSAVQHQTLQRVITQPDILFTVQDTGLSYFSRTGTSNWVNNGSPLQDGPGVIQPPIAINFNQLGPSLYRVGPLDYSNPSNFIPALPFWASYDATTNPAVVYPVNSYAANFTIFRFFLFNTTFSEPPSHFTWNLTGSSNALFSLQTSVDLSNWVTITTITNVGGTFTYEDSTYGNTSQRFFRTLPQ